MVVGSAGIGLRGVFGFVSVRLGGRAASEGRHRAGSQPSERMRVKLKASTCHMVTAFTL